MKKEDNLVTLDNSRFIGYLLGIYRTWKYQILNYSSVSRVMNSAKKVKNGLCILPIKTSSIILVTMILTNIFFSVLFNKEIRLLGWLTRAAFLFLGLGGLFCNVSWNEIKKTSFLLRAICHKKSH